jgi:site-specific DNA recombinase
MTESFETATPSGKAMLGMLAVFAAFERDSIGERIRAGMDTAFREEGRWLGGHRPPYGYVVEERGEKKYLTPYEPEAQVVRMMFELAAQGWSSVKIADYLAALQIPTPNAGSPALHWKTGKPASGVWQSGSVLRILRNPTYHGIRKRTPRKAKWPDQACEPLVDEKIWAAAQANLTRLRNPKTRPGEHTYILRGLLVCGACGRKYHGWPQDRGYYYYMCHGWRYKPRCAGKLLSTIRAEKEVWGRIEAWLAEEEAAAASLKGQVAAQQAEQAARDRERETLRQRIAAKSGERDRILGLYRRAVITEAELDRQLAEIQAEQGLLTERWEALSAPVAPEQVIQRAELAAAIRDELQRDNSPEARQRVCARMIEAIHVTTYPKRGAFSLEIIWKL